MKKSFYLNIIGVFLVITIGIVSRSFCAMGIVDVTNNYSEEDDNGVILAKKIAPFALYDTRNEEEIKNNIAYKKIIVIGCVEFPGIYLVKNNMTNRDLLRIAKEIAGRCFSIYPKIYGVDNKERWPKGAEYEKFLNDHPVDGEIYNVMSIIL